MPKSNFLSFLSDLKGQATVLNVLTTLLILAFVFNKYHFRNFAILLLTSSVVLFLLCSTAYVPNYLADKFERKYSPFTLPAKYIDSEKVLIHLLGSGYVLDKRLPANSQLGLVALGRLVEAIRVHRLIKNSVIVCPGNSPDGLLTDDQVEIRAAISLGVSIESFVTLNNRPPTTKDEAMELGRLYNKNCKLIIVTDAIHMPRAIKLFKDQGFNPIAAPTNYKVNEGAIGPNQDDFKWWPSFSNIGLMNYVIHEWLGNLKTNIFN